MSKHPTHNPTAKYKLSITQLQVGSWVLSAIVTILALIAWQHFYKPTIHSINIYTVFPLLGLLAFSLMWGHYVLNTIRARYTIDREPFALYYRITGLAVLILICLHPGLLIYQRFKDGFGFPPHSYESYVAPGLGWITILGSVSLLVFLSFELGRFFKDKSWWHYVVDASDAAMLAIVYHSIRLGALLQSGWYRYVWYGYAVILVGLIGYKYLTRIRKSVA